MTDHGAGAAFVARTSKGRTGIMLALSLAMVALGLAQFLSGELAFRLIGGFIALVFGAAAMMLVRRMRDPRPVIEVDASGIAWRLYSDERIPWGAIERAAVRRSQRQHFLCLWLRDPEAHPPRHRIVRLGGLNRRLGFGDIAIGTDGTDREVEDVASAVARYRQVDMA